MIEREWTKRNESGRTISGGWVVVTLPTTTHLVVEKSVRKVYGIGPGGIIGAADDLANIKASRVGLYGIFEGVQIFSR